jgi:hypothetical protein
VTVSIAALYNASFAGTSFYEQDSGGWHALHPTTTDGDVWHTPASNDATFHDTGQSREPFTVAAAVDTTEYQAMLGKRGDVGSLAYSGGTITVLLLDILDNPGLVGDFATYQIQLRFIQLSSVERPSVAVHVDTATFPSSSIVDITAYLAPAGFEIDLGVDSDNGSARVTLTSLPADATEGRRLYIYGDGTLIFNGEIAIGGTAWNADDTVTLSCVDALFKLRNAWGGPDRTYDSGSGDTDTSTAQNVVEASGIDASLTSIQGEGRLIGTAQDVVIYGGNIGIDGNPTQSTVMIEFLRKLDASVIPNHATFTRGNGAVYRRPRTIGGSVATFTEGSNAWGFDRQRQAGSIVNKWLVRGLTIATIPTEAEASAANAYLVAPWEYNQQTRESYLVDDPTWAQDLADWLLSDTNGRLNVVTWTSVLNNQTDILGSTVTATSSVRDLSSQDVYVTTIKHAVNSKTAVTTYTATFRD